ncbi:MAG: M56 family metallopeptidase, partial [Isosphaeraceae bacterium]
MIQYVQPGASLSWDLLWQSSLFLAIGLTASLTLRRHPARAHRVLLLAMFAAIVTPLLSQAIRRGGWGILKHPEPIVATTEAPAISRSSPRELAVAPMPSLLPARREIIDSPRPSAAASEALAAIAVSPAPSFSMTWRELVLGSWLLLSGLAIVRLLSGFINGYRMIHRAAPVEDETLREAASRAALRLGLNASPEVRSSLSLRCPSVWCWGRRPILLVPAESATAGKSIDWVAVFCHELAHWRRGDQIAALVGQLLICILPWNPLAWWAKGRLGQLAELACDDWVLASGMEGTDYAASLLELLPQRGASPALAAVSSRSGLAGRVRHILGDHHGSPTIRKGWALLTLVFTAVAASALAFAQAGSAPGRNEPSPVNPRSNNSPTKEPAARNATLDVMVQNSDGKPVPNAQVLWIGSAKPALAQVALPRDDPERRRDRTQVLARATTDEKGKARLSAEHAPGTETPTQLIVKSKGFGLGTRLFMRKPMPTEATITLAPEVPIHGRLLTPAGRLASGVRVLLDGFQGDSSKSPDEMVGAYAGLKDKDEDLPEYWPRSVKTDADGRFTISSVPPDIYATLSFWHPDYAVDEVYVSTVADGTIAPE